MRMIFCLSHSVVLLEQAKPGRPVNPLRGERQRVRLLQRRQLPVDRRVLGLRRLARRDIDRHIGARNMDRATATEHGPEVSEAEPQTVQGPPAIGLVLGLEPVEESPDGDLLNARDDGATLCRRPLPAPKQALRRALLRRTTRLANKPVRPTVPALQPPHGPTPKHAAHQAPLPVSVPVGRRAGVDGGDHVEARVRLVDQLPDESAGRSKRSARSAHANTSVRPSTCRLRAGAPVVAAASCRSRAIHVWSGASESVRRMFSVSWMRVASWLCSRVVHDPNLLHREPPTPPVPSSAR